METKILNYRVIIEPETYPDGSIVYNAYCPTLEITDYGNSIEKVLESIKEGILLAIESLSKEKKEIPVDNLEDQIITSTKIVLPSDIRIAFA